MTAPAKPPVPNCECGHPFLAHVTVHKDGCVGRPDAPCGPDCTDYCGVVDACTCRQYEPRPAPAPWHSPGCVSAPWCRCAEEEIGRLTAFVAKIAALVIPYPSAGPDDLQYLPVRLIVEARALSSSPRASDPSGDAGLRERVEALVHGPRPTLDEWLDPHGKAGLVRAALKGDEGTK